MSIVLCVGQGGCAIGEQFRALLPKQQQSTMLFVDTEPKVVQRLAVPATHKFYSSSGSGNNWALGYDGGMCLPHVIHGPDSTGWDSTMGSTEHTPTAHLVLNAMRKEVEKHDFFHGVVMMHSLGGGTGSGLGCHLMQAVRELFPSRHCLSAAILPFASGDTPLQHYNTLLSLAFLNQNADGTLLLDNEMLAKAKRVCDESGSSVFRPAAGTPGRGKGGKDATAGSASRAPGATGSASRDRRRPRSAPVERRTARGSYSLEELNMLAARTLASVLLPFQDRGEDDANRIGGGCFKNMGLGTLAADIFSYARFAEPFTSPPPNVRHLTRTQSVASATSTLLRVVPRHVGTTRITHIQSQLCLRGYTGGSSLDASHQMVLRHLNPVPWSAEPLSTVVSWGPGPGQDPTSSALCTCSTRIAGRFDPIVTRGLDMLQAGAYTHWFSRYGVEASDIAECANHVQGICDTIWEA